MSLSKLESHLLKLIIPFIRIAYIPGYGQFKVKGPMITVEADVFIQGQEIKQENSNLQRM